MTDFAFIDAETRSLLDLTVVGGRKYAAHYSTDVLAWSYLFDDQSFGDVWSPAWAWGDTVAPDPEEPTALLDHVENGGYVIAWNAFFDRWIWNEAMVEKYGWPYLRPDRVLCAMAQAEANNLPGNLEKACQTLGVPHQKDPAGKKLISMLCHGTRDDWPGASVETPDKMGHFRSYCLKDTVAMRDVWTHTRPLIQSEWDEYHASEEINDRGVKIDVEFAAAAREFATEEAADINTELAILCDDPKMTVTAHLRKAKWLYEQLWPDEELQDVVRKPERVKGKARYSADRQTREMVLDAILTPEHEALFDPDHRDDIIDFIELIEAGNSAAVYKFKAMVNQELDGRIYGQYCFNGAGQTGRFSSRGVQIHNLIRAPLEKGNPDRAMDAVDDILAGKSADYLVDKYELPLSRLLSRLIRPTFIAEEGKTLVWADFDQVEARVFPWLAMSPGGEKKLDLYRRGEPVYELGAAGILGKPVEDITEGERQAYGKVPELALQFGGSVGAFRAMGRNYGVLMSDAKAKGVVDAWRARNPWARNFWDELWRAAMSAWRDPSNWYSAGRVKYLYHETLMRGTLICMLPDGRWLVYPQFKHEKYEDDDGEIRWRTTFIRGYGSGAARIDLWYGILAENITQAFAASLLRRAMVTCKEEIVLHTHDEIVLEVPDTPEDIADASDWLVETMVDLPECAKGLPLSVSVENGPFYTK